MTEVPRIEIMLVAAAEAWRGDGEVLAAGMGPMPRVAAGLAKLTHSPELLLTDGESHLVEEPTPIGPRDGDASGASGWFPYARSFDVVWGGRRHAMVGPSQVDRWGQMNISCLGGHGRPKVQLVGVRGFPGISIYHPISMFVPAHSPRVFVPGEVDMVSSVGYRPERRVAGADFSAVDLRRIVTDLCVLDFEGPDKAMRIRSVHPGVEIAAVQAATGFPLATAENLGQTRLPTAEERAIIHRLDPHGLRAGVARQAGAGKPAAA